MAAPAQRPGAPPPKVAVPDPDREPAAPKEGVHEPVWLIRFVLVLFLVGFAAFLAREVANFVDVLP